MKTYFFQLKKKAATVSENRFQVHFLKGIPYQVTFVLEPRKTNMYGEVCSTHNNNKNNNDNNNNNNNNTNNNNLYSHHPQDHEHLCTSHKPTLQLSPRTAQNYTEPKNLLKSSRPLRAPASHRPFSVAASKRHAASQRRAAIQRRSVAAPSSVAASRRHPASQRRSAKQRRSVAPPSSVAASQRQAASQRRAGHGASQRRSAKQRRSVAAPSSVAA